MREVDYYGDMRREGEMSVTDTPKELKALKGPGTVVNQGLVELPRGAPPGRA